MKIIYALLLFMTPIIAYAKVDVFEKLAQEEKLLEQSAKKILEKNMDAPAIRWVDERKGLLVIDVKNMGIHDVFAKLSKITHKNFLVNNQVKEKVSLHLKCVSWKVIVDAIISAANLASHVKDNICFIVLKQQEKRYEAQRALPQVLINAKLVSVDRSEEEALGLQFKTHFSAAVLRHHIPLRIRLAALEREGKGEIIASPKLLTENGSTALIESGEEIPYQSSAGEKITKVLFKKAVLRLKVTPEIMQNQTIVLSLDVNQDKRSTQPDILGVPAIQTEKIKTTVWVKNHETVVLGGIYTQQKMNGEERIPFLGDIPLFGRLFTYQQKRHDKRELLIFITPEIIT